MILDLQELEDGAQLETDLCVIGGGPAGIAIAREFAGSKVDVCLLESGGHQYEPEAQALYAGANEGLRYFPLNVTRLRFLGGTTNHWTGRCGTMTEMDFRERPWVPHSGWPISKADLEPYYQRAQVLFRLGDYVYDEEAFEKLGVEAPAFDRDRLRARFWQFSPPVRFGPDFRDELAKAENIRVVLHANVTEIRTDRNEKTVQHIEVRTHDGRKGQVRAKRFVLACGGIENPRLMLASNSVNPAGVGNQHDLVGRFFMEHPKSRNGVVIAKDPHEFLYTFRKNRKAEVPYWAHFLAGEKLQEQEGILNSCAALYYEVDPEAGFLAAQEIWAKLNRGDWPDEFGTKMWRTLRDLDDMIAAGFSRYVMQGPGIISPGLLYLNVRAEQQPNPDSRITLGSDRDALGTPRARLDWRMTELDKRSIAVLTKTIGEELARLDMGRVKLEDWLLDGTPDWPLDLIGSHHHMGTTRMAEDPKRGVVDANSRVHGIDNLYVAGSSVFPTGSYVNPTLTIVSMSLRLADHLKGRFD